MHGFTGFGINSERIVVKALSKLETPQRLCEVASFVNVNRHRVHNLHLNINIDRLSLMDEDVFPIVVKRKLQLHRLLSSRASLSTKKKALLATVRFRRREFRLTRCHSDTIISMNSRYDPFAGRNLPPAIGRLICRGRSLPQKCGATFRTSLLCENEGPALGMSGFHVRTARYQGNRRTKH